MKIDPLQRVCSCGYYRYFNKYHYIKMLLFGSITVKCPQCGRVHEYKLIYHCVEDWGKTRIHNKDLAEGKRSIWKKG